MAKAHSKALDQTIEVGRFIGTIRGEQPGPSVIFLSGMPNAFTFVLRTVWIIPTLSEYPILITAYPLVP